MIKQGNSFGAFDKNGELCGTMFGATWELEERRRYKKSRSTPEIIVDRMYDTLIGGNIEELLGTNKFWELKFGCVNPKYKGTGIPRELSNRILERARQKGIRKLFSFAPYSPDRDGGYISKPLRLVHHGEYVDPVTGKREFEGMLPRYTHHALLILDFTPPPSL